MTDEQKIGEEAIESEQKKLPDEPKMPTKPVKAESPQPPEKVNYPRLPPRDFASLTPRDYISERLNDSIAWYDKTSTTLKSRFLNMRAITVIGSALVPVLINLDIPYINILTTIISLMVVVLVSFESVYHYSAQWTNYRSTEQFLRKEYFLFTANEGQYAEGDQDDAYRLFVQRVERAIQAEVATTLQVMNTTTTEGKSEENNWQAGIDQGSPKKEG